MQTRCPPRPSRALPTHSESSGFTEGGREVQGGTSPKEPQALAHTLPPFPAPSSMCSPGRTEDTVCSQTAPGITCAQGPRHSTLSGPGGAGLGMRRRDRPGPAPRLHSSDQSLVSQVGLCLRRVGVCPEGYGRELNHQSSLPCEGQRSISIHSPTISPEPGGPQNRTTERGLSG